MSHTAFTVVALQEYLDAFGEDLLAATNVSI